jgi:hypothetical protein
MEAIKVVSAFVLAVAVATMTAVALMFRDATAFAAFPFVFVFSLPFSTIVLAPILFVLDKLKRKSLIEHLFAGAMSGAVLAMTALRDLPKLGSENSGSIATFGLYSSSSLYALLASVVAAGVFWLLVRRERPLNASSEQSVKK